MKTYPSTLLPSKYISWNWSGLTKREYMTDWFNILNDQDPRSQKPQISVRRCSKMWPGLAAVWERNGSRYEDMTMENNSFYLLVNNSQDRDWIIIGAVLTSAWIPHKESILQQWNVYSDRFLVLVINEVFQKCPLI